MMMTTRKEMIEILQAAENGATIQSQRKSHGEYIGKDAPWIDTPIDNGCNWDAWNWRIKPQPREFWINPVSQEWFDHWHDAFDGPKECLDHCKNADKFIRVREVL